MNIYEKLAQARVELQQMSLKKSGRSNYAGYDYFELRDFLPAINEIMARQKMLGICSFLAEEATLTIVDAEKPEDTIVFRSPHAEAVLKGCHPIQNQGAEETYQRRYLWTMAFEIVEDDALDATQGRPDKKKAPQTDENPLGQGRPQHPEQPTGGDTCEACGAKLTDAQKLLAQKAIAEGTASCLLCATCRRKEGANDKV